MPTTNLSLPCRIAIAAVGLATVAGHSAANVPSARLIASLDRYIISHPMLVDLNQDGLPEIVLTSSNKDYTEGRVDVLHLDGSSAPGWPVTIAGRAVNSTPAIGDIDGDNRPEIIVQSMGPSARIYAFRDNAAIVRGFPVVIGTLPLYANNRSVSPSLSDLDGNGVSEIVALAPGFPRGPNRVLAISGAGRILWDTVIPRTAHLNSNDFEYFYKSTPMIGHMIANQQPQIIVGLHTSIKNTAITSFNRFFALSATGNILPGWPIQVGPPIAFIDELGSLGDLNGDGRDELVFVQGTFDSVSSNAGPSWLHVRTGSGLLAEGFPVMLPGLSIYTKQPLVPALVNTDGKLNIVTVNFEGIASHLVVYAPDGNQLIHHEFVGGTPMYTPMAPSVAATQEEIIVVVPMIPKFEKAAAIYALDTKYGLLPGFPLRLPNACAGTPLASGLFAGQVALFAEPNTGRLHGIHTYDCGDVVLIDFDLYVHSIPWPQFQGDASHTASARPTACSVGACLENDTTICLNGGRFEVKVDFDPPNDIDTLTEPARAKRLTADTGFFTFFDPNNVEAVIKVLNACSVNGRHWFFAGGLTNVLTEIRVCDKTTGVQKQYRNPQSTPFQPIQDTDAFPTCP